MSDINRDCNECGNDEFETVLQQDDNHTPNRERHVVECQSCGSEGTIFTGEGVDIYSGVLR